MSLLHHEHTHRLGSRAYFLFLGRAFLWLLLLIGLQGVWYWYGAALIPKGYVEYYDYSVKLFALFLAAGLVFLLLKAYLEYRSHGYRFDDEFFHITRGYLTQQEVGVVYHQIQTVTIVRSLGSRMVGVANLTIISSNSSAGAETHLRGIDARKARLVQRELLARAKASQGHRPTGGYQAVPFEEEEGE